MNHPFAAGAYNDSSSCEECHRGCWQNELATHNGRDLCAGCALEAAPHCYGCGARGVFLRRHDGKAPPECAKCLGVSSVLIVVVVAAMQRGPRKCITAEGMTVDDEMRSA